MGEPGLPEPHDEIENSRMASMLDTLGEDITSGHHEAATELIDNQTFIAPFDMAKWLEFQRTGMDDTEENFWHWSRAVRQAISRINGEERQSLPNSDLGWLVRVTEKLEFDIIVSNPAVAEEVNVPEMPSWEPEEIAEARPDYPYDWREDKFEVDLQPDVIEGMKLDPLFRRAVNELSIKSDKSFADRIDTAKSIIRQGFRGERKGTALKVLDGYLFEHIELVLKGEQADETKDVFADAKEMTFLASSDSVRRRMSGAVDKYVFDLAGDYLVEHIKGTNSPEYEARLIINTYSSTIERRTAMLEDLGLL